MNDPDQSATSIPRQRPVISPVDHAPSAGDHDITRFQLVPSASLHVTLPERGTELENASFYIGEGMVILKNQLFEPSSAARHCAEELKNMRY